MTGQEHAAEIRRLCQQLSEAIASAQGEGIDVDIDIKTVQELGVRPHRILVVPTVQRVERL